MVAKTYEFSRSLQPAKTSETLQSISSLMVWFCNSSDSPKTKHDVAALTYFSVVMGPGSFFFITRVMRTYKLRKRENPCSRKGAALIELAVCLPVFFLITMATIETCRMIYLRQSLKIAAYECARIGIVPGITVSAMQDQCDAILVGRNVSGYTFSCDPPDPADLQYSDLLKVSIQIAAKDNAMVGTWLYRDKILTESVTIMAEY